MKSFKTNENQEKIEVWKITKENSKERKVYEDEMDKVKSNDLKTFLGYLFINSIIKVKYI